MQKTKTTAEEAPWRVTLHDGSSHPLATTTLVDRAVAATPAEAIEAAKGQLGLNVAHMSDMNLGQRTWWEVY